MRIGRICVALLAVAMSAAVITASLADTITLKQGGTSRKIVFLAVSSSDHITGVTGLLTGGSTITEGTGSATTSTIYTTTAPVVGTQLTGTSGTNNTYSTVVQSYTGSSNPYTVSVAPALHGAPSSSDTFSSSAVIIQLSKNAGAFAAPAGTMAEIGSGLYALYPSSADTGTVGSLIVHVTATGADPSDKEFNVQAINVDDSFYMGLGALGAVVPVSGSVADGSSTTTVVDSGITGGPDLSGSMIVFTSGALTGCFRQIGSMNTSNGQMTLLAALPAGPANGVSFGIVAGSKGLSQFLAALGSDSRPKVSADAHSGGVSIAGITGTTLPATVPSFPSNFGSLAITGGGAVTAGTVSDKSGYVLTQAFPTNFSSLAISGGGAVTAGTVSDKSGYSLSQAFPSNFSLLSIDGSGKVALQTGEHTLIGGTDVWGAATRTLSAFAFQPTVGGYASGQDPATSVWSALTASFNASNTFGHALQSIGGASDPWSTALPGSYSSGQAGYLLSHLPDTAGVSTLLTRLPGALTVTSGGVTVAGYASGQDPFSVMMAGIVDGNVTVKQILAVNWSLNAADYSRTWDALSHTATIVHYRMIAGSNVADYTRPLSTETVVYDATNSSIVSRHVTPSNLP